MNLLAFREKEVKKAKPRKYRGMFEVLSPEKARQLGKSIGLNNLRICKSQMELILEQVSGGVSVPIGIPHKSQMLYETFRNSVRGQFGNKVIFWCQVWSVDGVIVYGQATECNLTFVRGELHIVW